MKKHLCLLLLLLSVVVSGQTVQEPRTLVSGQSIERELAGGESHTYQIPLTAGQFVRFSVDQRAIDVALVLTAPDGKQIVEMNLTGAGDQESLSLEATAPGSYRLTLRSDTAATQRGAYRLEAAVRATATAQDRQRLMAEVVLVEANELSKQAGKTAQQVIEKLQRTLPVWRELEEPIWTAYSLFLIGSAYNDLSQFGKAIEFYDQALAISHENKLRAREGRTLNNLGRAYLNMSRVDKAIEYLDQALAICREVKDPAGQGSTLNNLGLSYQRLSRYQKAIDYLEQALAIRRDLRDRTGEAGTLNNLGNAYSGLSRTEKAIEYTEQALAIFRELKNRALEGAVLNNLGTRYREQGRSEKAIEYYEQALPIFREMKNRASERAALSGLGNAYQALSRYEKAIEYQEQSLAIARDVKDRGGEGGALMSLGNAYLQLSRTEKAIEYYEQALTISREVKNRQDEAIVLANLGNAYQSLSRYEKAIEYLEQALAISREVMNRQVEGSVLAIIGNAYRNLVRTEKAIEYYDQALQIFREVKDRDGEREALSGMGIAYVDLKRYEKAIENFEQVLAISREVKNRAGEGGALQSLGIAYLRLKRYEKAIEYFEQALAISREVKNRSGEGGALMSLGNAYLQLSRHEKAIECFEQALEILREMNDRVGEANSLGGLARAESARGNLLAARAHIEECLSVAESVRSDTVSGESRASFLGSGLEFYQLHIDLLMRLHQAEPAKGFDALALEGSERQRARSLLDLLTEARADVRQGVDAALLERERLLGRQLNDKAQRLIQTNEPEQVAALKREISRLETDYERAQADIRKASPQYAALTQPQPLKLKEIQRQLDADTLLLEYALGEDRSYLWAITRDSLTSYELPKAESIDKDARRLHEILSARSTTKRGESALQRQERIAQAEAQLPAAAKALSQALLAPVAQQLGNKRLVIVADGALQYIPFAMLPDPVAGIRSPVAGNSPNANRLPNTDYRPLIVAHEVVSLSSASALAIQRTELAGRQPAPKLLAVIADPVFDRTDARFKTPAADTGDKTQAPAIAFNDARSIEHLADKSDNKSGDRAEATIRRLVIPRLPFTRQEAIRLQALVPGNSSFAAMDFQASNATVLKGELTQYRYVHFATHGLVDTERPGLSSLVLSMVDAEGKPQDGFLRLKDIYNLKLPADLVVLSACQTGLGKEIKGEGMVALTRGFMYAGAARVVVSLWSVNDKATAELMTRFYEKMLKQGARPAAALRAAQVELLKQKQWQSPYYWAAFTMQGEWR